MKIDSFRSGQIIIEGKRYDSDVIVFPHHVNSNWWREEGHQVRPEDINDIIQEKPEILVVGTGEEERMRIMPETRIRLAEQEIELVYQATDKACQTYNQLRFSHKVIGAFHLTC